MPAHAARRRAIALAVAAASLAVAAGCSSESSDITEASTPSTPTAVTTPTTPTGFTTPTSPTTPTVTTGTGTTPTTAASGQPDPCALLTAAQIEAAVGTPPGTTRPESDDRCNFGVVRTWVGFGEAWIDSAASKGEEVAGVGDRAAYDPEFHQIYVKSGATTFNIQCTLCTGDQKAVLTRLAGDALGNLG
ncbi:MAG: hypothetical protein KDC33_12055 [Thermoleophilia bacterium]|nr:hypothetical protein [Thermoleophilia bacterium]